MTTLLYILITALVIGFLTFIHEFGHFFFARLFKVPVLEFAIGMGPKIYSWEGKSGTKYALRAFPIGGFVQMEGEEGTSENPNAYNNLNPWKKIVVTIAGPLVNIIFAVIVMFGIVASSSLLGSTVVGEFYEASTSNAQIQVGDEIVKIGERDLDKDIIFDSRTAWYFIPKSFKVFLDIAPHEQARRLINSKRDDEIINLSPEEAIKSMDERWNLENERYREIYDFDNRDQSVFDCVVDTTDLKVEEVADRIYEAYMNYIK